MFIERLMHIRVGKSFLWLLAMNFEETNVLVVHDALRTAKGINVAVAIYCYLKLERRSWGDDGTWRKYQGSESYTSL
tara:strand:+ start:1239 stop:1469 length:231 start_codon:yes stop_codon:yes gene_type:complete